MARTFHDLIAANQRTSFLLVAGFVLFITIALLTMGLGIVAVTNPEAVKQLDVAQAALFGGLAFVLAAGYALFSYYAGSSVILAVSGAREIDRSDDLELFNVVEEMSIAAGVPMPKVYVMDDPSPNAFATGRDPEHGVVCITTGLRQRLTREELQGVIAHEIAHIRNYDIRLMMLLAVLIGLLVMMADLFRQILWFGPRSRRSSSKDGNPLILLLIVVAVVLAIVGPILARIIQMAVSREREYLADASAVEFTRNPIGLASALRKLTLDPHELQVANRGTAHLFIVNPVKKFSELASTMFASHPPINERIARLVALAGPAEAARWK